LFASNEADQVRHGRQQTAKGLDDNLTAAICPVYGQAGLPAIGEILGGPGPGPSLFGVGGWTTTL